MLSDPWSTLAANATVVGKSAFTLYHTVLTLNNPKEEGFGKHCGKRIKCWYPAFSLFPTVFSTLSKKEILILATFILSSANAFDLVTSKLLSLLGSV